MESGIQSSFIPHDAAVQTKLPGAPRASGLQDLLFLAAIVLLVASIALAGAVFLYEQYLGTSEASKVEQLKRAKEAFEPSLIQELTRLDDRMHAADVVLTNHIAPTALFQALSQSTLTTIAFKSMAFEAADANNVTIKMSGLARSVNSIALQADLFSKNGVVTNPIFSDINRQADGVHFNLRALINPSAVNYVQVLAGSRAAQPQQNVQTSPFQSGGTQ